MIDMTLAGMFGVGLFGAGMWVGLLLGDNKWKEKDDWL